MRIDKIGIIAKREYLARIKTKGFWIGTVLLPVMMVGLTILPAYFLSKAENTVRLALVDETGTVGDAVAARLTKLTPAAAPGGELEGSAGREDTSDPAAPVSETAKAPPKPTKPASASETRRQLEGGRRQADVRTTFVTERVAPQADTSAQRKELDRRVLDKELDAWVWISPEGLAEDQVEYHGESTANFLTQERLERALYEAVREVRLAGAGYDARKVGELSRPIGLQTVRVTKEGGRAEAGMAGVLIAYVLFFILYMMLAVYGQQVMHGVLEEKTSRIVEVIVSSVEPFELLLGKLVGIGSLGLTQMLIWLTTAAVVTAPGVVAAIAGMPSVIPSVSPILVLHALLFFILGFFLYATYYAALGSAFNDIREAQQASSSAMFLLIPPVLLALPVINDSDSTLAVVASLIPFFTPLLMVLRIAVKMPPWWQLALGYTLTFATTIAMVWACGKIYRVGILMYGKKPTLQELWRWLRYA